MKIKYFTKLFKFFYPLRLSSRNKLFLRCFYLIFSDKFYFLEPLFNKVKKFLLRFIFNKKFLRNKEMLETCDFHIKLYNNKISVAQNQVLLAQQYADFFEQQSLILKFLRKEGFFFKFNPSFFNLRFSNRAEALAFKKRREKRLKLFINSRKYFVKAYKIFLQIENQHSFFLLKRACRPKESVNSLMRQYFFKKYKYFFLLMIVLIFFGFLLFLCFNGFNFKI